MHHLYLSIHNNAAALQQERDTLVAWCKENGVNDYSFIEDNLTMGRIPDRAIRSLLKPIHQGDTVVVSEISRLGRSLSMFQSVMNHIRDNECTIITLGGRVMEPNRTMSLFVNALNDIVEIERQMKAFRSNDVLFKMREEGGTPGRPVGTTKNPEKMVLFGKEERLRQMYADHVPINKIMAELEVSRGTITNYLKANGLYRGWGKKGTTH